MSSTWSHLSGTHLHHKSSIVRNITISLNKIERKIDTCFVECYVLIVLGSCYHIVLWSTEFATNCLVIIYHSLALGISRIQILKKIHNDALFSRWHVAAIGYKSLQMAAITCFHLQPLPVTCSHFPKQPLAATSNHLQPLAATSSHLQPLATTCPSSHKQPLAAICSDKQPQATTCNHLPKQPLAATCSHLQPFAATCPSSHLQPLAATGKWLQMAAFLKIKLRTSCAHNENSCTNSL